MVVPRRRVDGRLIIIKRRHEILLLLNKRDRCRPVLLLLSLKIEKRGINKRRPRLTAHDMRFVIARIVVKADLAMRQSVANRESCIAPILVIAPVWTHIVSDSMWKGLYLCNNISSQNHYFTTIKRKIVQKKTTFSASFSAYNARLPLHPYKQRCKKICSTKLFR